MRRYLTVAALFFVAVFTALAQSSYAETKPGELISDKETVKEEESKIKARAQAARVEEKAMKSGIRETVQSGDKAKAGELRKDFKSTHKADVRESNQDKKDLNKAKKEFKQDAKAVRRSAASGGRK